MAKETPKYRFTDVPRGQEIDPECVNLCEAINQLDGLSTFSSCSGHGDKPASISISVEDIRAIAPLLCSMQWCDRWKLTPWLNGDDCRYSVDFELSGPVESIEEIAGNVLSHVTKRHDDA